MTGSDEIRKEDGMSTSEQIFKDGEWQDPTKVLVLHVEVPGFYVEDLQEAADEWCDGDVGRIVTDEMIRAEVGVTFVTVPGEKCLNSDFEVESRTCRVVGAEVRDAS